MSVTKPFRPTCRQFVDGGYGGAANYIEDQRFANDARQYVRAYRVIQKDLLELFDYVEPADLNRNCYSYRIHELLMRTCIEVEANCKAILTDNGYAKPSNWNIDDYKKLNRTHRLHSYEVKFPIWDGNKSVRRPYSAWARRGGKLTWYRAYNQTKHDRHKQFKEANFHNLLDAVSGLVVLLSSQFHTHDFLPLAPLVGDRPDDYEVAIGEYFLVKFPRDWPIKDRYSFDWEKIKNDADPFWSLKF
jgi:hypothetical protein